MTLQVVNSTTYYSKSVKLRHHKRPGYLQIIRSLIEFAKKIVKCSPPCCQRATLFTVCTNFLHSTYTHALNSKPSAAELYHCGESSYFVGNKINYYAGMRLCTKHHKVVDNTEIYT